MRIVLAQRHATALDPRMRFERFGAAPCAKAQFAGDALALQQPPQHDRAVQAGEAQRQACRRDGDEPRDRPRAGEVEGSAVTLLFAGSLAAAGRKPVDATVNLAWTSIKAARTRSCRSAHDSAARWRQSPIGYDDELAFGERGDEGIEVAGEDVLGDVVAREERASRCGHLAVCGKRLPEVEADVVETEVLAGLEIEEHALVVEFGRKHRVGDRYSHREAGATAGYARPF